MMCNQWHKLTTATGSFTCLTDRQTETDTHTQRERERERERPVCCSPHAICTAVPSKSTLPGGRLLSFIGSCSWSLTSTAPPDTIPDITTHPPDTTGHTTSQHNHTHSLTHPPTHSPTHSAPSLIVCSSSPGVIVQCHKSNSIIADNQLSQRTTSTCLQLQKPAMTLQSLQLIGNFHQFYIRVWLCFSP